MNGGNSNNRVTNETPVQRENQMTNGPERCDILFDCKFHRVYYITLTVLNFPVMLLAVRSPL